MTSSLSETERRWLRRKWRLSDGHQKARRGGLVQSVPLVTSAFCQHCHNLIKSVIDEPCKNRSHYKSSASEIGHPALYRGQVSAHLFEVCAHNIQITSDVFDMRFESCNASFQVRSSSIPAILGRFWLVRGRVCLELFFKIAHIVLEFITHVAQPHQTRFHLG